MKTNGKLLTVHEAEQRTGRKVSTWRKYILLRKIAYVKIGRSVRIPEEVIEAIIKKGWREPLDGAIEIKEGPNA
jgi:excisionase family DNA binding protein